MTPQSNHVLDTAENYEFIHGLLEQRLSRHELVVPLLPEVAIRVMRLSGEDATTAGQLAALIEADPALTMYVLRVAASAAKRPATPVVSLHQAVAWLGFETVTSIAFTLALQGKMLNVPGQSQTARRLWRHSLASALWSKHLSHMLARDAGLGYLCGLLHTVGKPVTLSAANDLAQRAQIKLATEQYLQLIETFHRHVGALVVGAWGVAPLVQTVLLQWEAFASAGPARIDCALVNLAHRLADMMLAGSTGVVRDLVEQDPAYAELSLSSLDAVALFEAVPSIGADLDAFLPP